MMRGARHIALVLALVAMPAAAMPAAASQAAVNDALRGNPSIYNGLFAIAVADQVRKKCDSISPRMVSAFLFARSLQAEAREMGFSDDEIDAFLDSDAEKDRLRASVTRYFAQNGVVESDPETYCALGRTEIARASQAGVLLRAR
ncbi:DUF5333 domain-containing protein [Roseicitreum antarcticum]|uniref:NADH dehydrogenase subunit E n=1 Tax=Roseicitreum antarcticum TaxID=564137 RepID=A0A1H2ZRW1_9RHOB|nr:DUF5333 domain-containing protein [Roseicitreum antarcticum]SDX20065.1 hypothetical protein SAMN04488238_10643 [Roseicitreum antarcticum]